VLAHLAAQDVAVFIKLDTVGLLTAYLAEHVRFSDNTALKFAIGIVCERFAIRALDRLTVFHPKLVVTVELTTFYFTAGVKLNTDIAIQLGDRIRRES
jgi:hypothetical protein